MPQAGTSRDLAMWNQIVGRMLRWMTEFLLILWKSQGIDLPGLSGYVEQYAYDFGEITVRQMRKSGSVCGLLLKQKESS